MNWEYVREYVLDPCEDSPAEARAHVRDALTDMADDDTLDRVQLVVSELVTNSVLYGPGEPITLRLTIDAAGRICGEIEDQGEGAVAMPSPDSARSVGGLGLSIVDRLVSAWGVHPGSSHVWFRFASTA
jgi:anti-sigma regulatory factor (Ser/Thr protein kinase)